MTAFKPYKQKSPKKIKNSMNNINQNKLDEQIQNTIILSYEVHQSFYNINPEYYFAPRIPHKLQPIKICVLVTPKIWSAQTTYTHQNHKLERNS